MASVRNSSAASWRLFRSNHRSTNWREKSDRIWRSSSTSSSTQGLPRADAKLAARRAFGGVEQTKEHQRDARSFRWIDDMRQDVGYALRSLKRTPGFTLAAVVTLAVGIGATTAIYSVVDRVLLQPLPFKDSDRLVYVREPQRPTTMMGVNRQEYLEWRSKMTSMSGLAAYAVDPMALIRTREGTVRLSNGMISTNYFEVLGLSALAGRTILSSDDANLDVAVPQLRSVAASLPWRRRRDWLDDRIARVESAADDHRHHAGGH